MTAAPGAGTAAAATAAPAVLCCILPAAACCLLRAWCRMLVCSPPRLDRSQTPSLSNITCSLPWYTSFVASWARDEPEGAAGFYRRGGRPAGGRPAEGTAAAMAVAVRPSQPPRTPPSRFPRLPRCSPQPKQVANFPLGIWSGAFLLLSAADHLLVALPQVNATYNRLLCGNRNPFRWAEYAVSASIMMVRLWLRCVGVWRVWEGAGGAGMQGSRAPKLGGHSTACLRIHPHSLPPAPPLLTHPQNICRCSSASCAASPTSTSSSPSPS